MNSLLYADLQLEQLKRLEKVDDVVTAKALLSAMFGVPQDPSQEWRTGEDSLQYIKDEPLWAILSDLYFYAFVFTKDQRFNRPKTSAFMAILKKLIETDINTTAPDIHTSFKYFKELLFTHSVERHPLSSKIFEPAESKAILQYMTDSYYRHFKLYQYNFTKRNTTVLVQTSPSCVETMKTPRPLSQALSFAVQVPNQEEAPTEPEQEQEQPEQQEQPAMPTFSASMVHTMQEKPLLMTSASMPVMPAESGSSSSSSSTFVAGSPSNAARAKQQARDRLKNSTASADMRWQYRWKCNSRDQWGTYPTAVTDAIEKAFVAQQDAVINVGGGTYQLYRYTCKQKSVQQL
jgi:hypothetical protein